MIDKTGDWAKVAALLAGLETKLKTAEQIVLAKIAIKAEELAVSRIDEQPTDWQALSEDYAKRKAKKGVSDLIYVATSSYKQAITSFVVKNVAYAGLKKTAQNKSGAALADIARTLEYGSVKKNIPPRPLWLPTEQKLLAWLKESRFVEREFWRAVGR